MINAIFINKKRGAISSAIADFWAYVAFVFVILIFYVFFTYQAKGIGENKITETTTKISNDLQLLNYLRTPYILDGMQITMADLIVLYNNEKDYDKKKLYYDEITKKTSDIFNPMEFCVSPKGRSDQNVNGYGIFILDKESYLDERIFNNNYKGTKQNEDKKFSSEHFFDGLIVEKSLGVIPNITPNQLIYVGFFVSSANTFGKQIQGVRGCV